MAAPIDTAFVDIRPDFSGFAIETERGIKRQLAAVDGGVSLGRTDTRGIRTGTKDIDGLNSSLRTTRGNAAGATSSLALLGGTAARSGAIAGAGLAGIGIGAALAVKSVTDASIEFETAFSGVVKTVSATPAELEEIRQGFIDLSTEIPVTASELARIGEAAGQLGIKTSAIDEFTETVANLGATTNLTSDVAADALARIANITGLPQDQFSNLGSTIVDLGNKLAATESEITEFGLRIAGAGTQVGLSEQEILSIGAALASVGLEAEAGGTAISTTLVKIASAVAGGGKKLQEFAKVAGVTGDEFRKRFADDPAGALVAFISGLGRVDDAGGNVFATLEKLGLGGIRVRDALLRSSNAGDLLARSLKIGENAFQSNTALAREASIRYETTASKIQVLRNQVNALAIDLGDKLGPAIGDGAEALGEGIAKIRSNEDVGDVISRGFENVKAVVEPLFDVFRRNRSVIEDTFRNAGESIRVLGVLLKPVAFIVGVTLVVAFESIFFAIDKVNIVSRLFGDAIKKSVSVAVGAIDVFLGSLSFLTGAIDRLPGVDLSGTTDAINAARESLRGFVDDLNGVEGKSVTASVKLDGVSAAKQEIAALQSALGSLEGAGIRTDVAPEGAATFGLTKLPTGPTGKPGDVSGGPALVDVPKAIQAKEQRLQDNLALAQALDESTTNDKAALRTLAAFYDEQANNLKLSAALRRGFLVRAEQSRQQIRDLDSQAASDAQGEAESTARGAIAAAEATKKTLADDIRAARGLVTVLKQRVAQAQATGQGVAQAKEDLAAAERGVVEKINERKEHRIDLRVEAAKTAVVLADATKLNLRDDVQRRRELVAVLKERVRVAKETNGDVAAARQALNAATRDLGETIKDTGQKRADLLLDAIEDQKKLASFTTGTKDDENALRAEERFWRKRINSLKRGSVERRKARIELARTQKDLRDLKDPTDSGGGTTLADLFSKQTGIARGAGFDVGPQIAGQVTQPIENAVSAKLSLDDPTVTVDRVDPSTQKQIDSNDRLIQALERLATVVAGNAAANAGEGGGTTYATVTGARAAAMGRYWQSRRNSQLQEETASA